MKARKYLLGGLLRGSGGKATKAFMKSDLYKDLKSAMIKKVNKMYSSTPASDPRAGFLKGLKKLDIKGQKADIIKKALSITSGPVESAPRGIKAALKRGARNIGKYRKSINQKGEAYLKKGENLLRGKKDN
jgi:hypothetical protein|tara:strand:- start:390 stop:782 length:393 start_codon:yes stop_codon:yes gene_type:complete